jgi:hypothetical protein
MTLRITANRCQKIKVPAEVTTEGITDGDSDVGIAQEAADDIANSTTQEKKQW